MFQLHSDVTAHICADGLQKNIDLLLGSYTIPHKHLVGFLQNMEIALYIPVLKYKTIESDWLLYCS